MDLPQPPNDVELRNIIDKLAQFVARNGPEFEQMTKNKQKGNPKFSFLFGGEHFNYYQYKVTTEQAILKAKAARESIQQMSTQPPLPGAANNQPGLALIGSQTSFAGQGLNNSATPSNPTPLQIINAAASATQWLVNHQQQAAVSNSGQLTLNSIIEQQSALNQQITQSEQNLAAQHAVLLQNQQAQIEEAIRKTQAESLSKRAADHNVNLQDFDAILQPIIDSCTKDSISSGKAWILSKNTPEAHQIVSQYLLSKVIAPGAPFSQKLHIIYLINDVMHHCVRKNAEGLKKSLEEVVVPMFCSSSVSITEEHKAKLNKLINLWEVKNNYFSKEIIAKLKTPEKSWAEYQANLISQNVNIVNSVTLATKASFENYQSQHQAFVNHALQQIQNLESQKIQFEQNNEVQNQFQVQQNSLNQVSMMPNVMDHNLSNQPPVMSQPPPNLQDSQSLSSEVNIPMKFDAPPPLLIPNRIPLPIDNVNFSQPPPTMFQHLPPDLIPDFSKPPPGFPTKENVMDDLIPSVPYFELPAGLMVPLIKLDDSNYKPIDPDKIRLPPAVPPSERLIQAVEAFYQRNNSNTRERLILDADGWEKLGLYEYYKAKNAAKKKKEEEIQDGLREKSRSPTPIKREKSRSRSPKKKRYRSKSRSKSREREKDRERDRSKSSSRSPVRHHRSSNGKKSPRRSASSRSYKRSRSRSRSISPPSRNRSPTPPSFSGSNYGKPLEQHLDESNKGHQMLKKMGWSGAGLGSKEQGIEAPIAGGEVRDKVDQYKGVGVNLHDPYENFRKSKGQAFITRMKARAEERMSSS
ncbi:conserved hypothetical protein [Pediculus humanus corporis]|uniref:Calcium homeostasis endoplasmic reticulum protein n=1 Tax=Pediculus humanus subsp. corporis TaxID=121224 RepID=E0VUQ4_PEDHC|nr:uncharacterized protein Phum_PHUM452910 [Pediculus humanus corporis]EEB17110.1 conserved hypothetical protein [Pediculus humanus corporis]